MHIGLVTYDLAGHLNPLTALGAALRERGHAVTLLGGRPAQPYADRAGIDLAPIGVEGDCDLQLAAGWRELGRLSGIASMRHTGRMMSGLSRVILRDAPQVIAKRQLDALVVDQFAPAGVAAADRCDIPSIIVCNALAAHYDRYSPPPPMPWRYRRDGLGRVRNMLAKRLIPPLYNWFADAASTGVRPLQLVFEQEHGLAQLAQQPAFFDFPRALTDHFHYTAPWHQDARDDDVPFPWERLDGRPLIYASMGTLQNNLPYVFGAIADAVRELDVQVVLSQGGCEDELHLDLPDHVILVKHAPQLRLLDRAALAITHAGLNTALECIARGVPMVCLPVTNDQPGVAMRVAWLGLGETIPVKRVTAGRLRGCIERVLQEPQYRETAARYRRELSTLDGPKMAAELVSQALERGGRLERSDVAPCEATSRALPQS
jgi:zeaxanthin glucosyltransferase